MNKYKVIIGIPTFNSQNYISKNFETIQKEINLLSNYEVIFYENMGQILGVLISLGFTLKYSNLKYIFFISSCFALIACILMIKYKESNHE